MPHTSTQTTGTIEREASAPERTNDEHTDAEPTDAVWHARGVALLMPADSSAEVAVVLQVDDVPAGIVLDIFGSSQLFVRMRHGALVHGLTEPYRQRETSNELERGPAVLTSDDHYVARLRQAATLFGAQDTVVLLPFGADRAPHRRLSIPMTSATRPRRALFELVDGEGEPCYDFIEELAADAAFVCPVCGKYCETNEPHTALHGVPGHYRAGTRPGRPGDDTRSWRDQGVGAR
jgi:hypothetical protein